MSARHIRKVAIVGAGGNCGSFITQELLHTGKHDVTAITRQNSGNTFPDAVTVKKVDYDDSSSLVNALQGIEALVITLSGRSSIQDVEGKLVQAAAEAGVSWILPNEWSPDTANKVLVRDIPFLGSKVATRELITSLGKSSFISVVTGFWYEWSLGNAKNYGFDFANRSAVFFDDGTTKICTTTWPQIGRAVAAILSLPIEPGSGGKQLSLEGFRNKVIYVKSFTVSQSDMLDSVLRVTDAKREDWKVSMEPAVERWQAAAEGVKAGKFECYPAFLYTRLFFNDGSGDFETGQGIVNDSLGLPEEDLDQATKKAIVRQLGSGAEHEVKHFQS